tara:strand:+ start:1604 stop:2818 length:1215 start_codon:yes stop_codon:yes gene_type:complete
MSEETKAKVVEEENPSAAEKETKALKKMGFDTGVEEIAKVDLRKPKEEKDATEEQSADEVPVRDGSEASEEVRKEDETQPEEPAGESQKEEEKEEAIVEEVEKTEQTQEEPVKEEQPIQQSPPVEQPEINVPEGVLELVNFMNETGGSMEDYIRLNKNYGDLDNKDLIKEYYSITKPHLTSDEANFLIEDNYSFDKEIDDPIDIKRKELAYKEEVAKAKQYLESQKNQYYKEVKNTGGLSREQQKAVDFFNRYNTEQQEIAQQQEKATNQFKLKTNEVFNQEFKGFDFNIDNKTFRYKLKDVDNVKNTQMDVMNVIGSYLDENRTLKDGYGYHKALFAAKNADSIANHFYQLGKTEAVKEIAAESKNINMDPRQTSSGVVESGGIKVRAISGDDSSKLRIKLKK